MRSLNGTIRGNGEEVFAAMCKNGGEGIVSKKPIPFAGVAAP
ncbi:MAG TPA: hypothetical protein VNQ14_03770 [Woeseiaceae bacterium]|nr:hypothetical protein [Woeseiaceae bacterium]